MKISERGVHHMTVTMDSIEDLYSAWTDGTTWNGNKEIILPRKYYTEDEIVLCTYAAMYNAQDFGGIQMVRQMNGRSTGSISAKIRNIIAMLDANNISHANSTVGLTGNTTGLKARETNWDIVESLTHLPKQQLLKQCMDILRRYQ